MVNRLFVTSLFRIYLISMFSGINKCLQGHNIFVIEFDSFQYQIFVISLIHISAEFPAYNVGLKHEQGCPMGYPYGSVKIFPRSKLHIRMQIKIMQNLAIH